MAGGVGAAGELVDPKAPRIQACQARREVPVKRGQEVRLRGVLAGEILVGEVAVLDPRQLSGIEVEIGREGLYFGQGLGQVRGRPVERRDGRVEAARRLGRGLLEQMAGASQVLLGRATGGRTFAALQRGAGQRCAG